MRSEELISIGRFARLSGLSIGALRHYAQLEVLCPAAINPETGYRSYARSQLEDARLIARLRGMEMPLAEIRAVLCADGEARQAAIATHRRRLQARTSGSSASSISSTRRYPCHPKTSPRP